MAKSRIASSHPTDDTRDLIDDLLPGMRRRGILPNDDVRMTTPPGGGRRRVLEGPVVRRRGRLLEGTDDLAPATLVRNEHGVLLWHDGTAAGAVLQGRRMRRGTPAAPGGDWVQTLPFTRLERNKVTEFIAGVDDWLNGEWGVGNSFILRRVAGGKIISNRVAKVEGRKKRLLFVHGTFSKTQAFIDGIAAAPGGAAASFWQWAAGKYEEILCFDHPTLSVSPILNALDLSRAFSGASGDLDVIAHSRGGLVARWFLEVFGAGSCTNCRAVLVGAPLAGTGLASPARLRSTLSALTNLGNAVKGVTDVASLWQPWLAGPAALMRIATSFTGALAATPVLDATIALIPGLHGQSRVGNNPEIGRMRDLRPIVPPTYLVVRSNFETEKPGWQFWKWFRLGKIVDAGADVIFDGENDLVVDTLSMNDAGTSTAAMRIIHDFGTNDQVYHTNYFTRGETLTAIKAELV